MSVHPQPLYFCLRVPEFAAQAMLRLRPAERTMPVAVVEGVPPLETVCAANSRARRMGVKRGLSPAELDSFPGLCVLRRSPKEERNACAVLHELAASFTPRFQDMTQQKKSVNSANNDQGGALLLALDMTGTECVFGPPEVAARGLLRAARDLGFQVRVAASANLHAAVCVARSSLTSITILQPGTEEIFLAKLPLDALSPGETEAETLALWGIRTVGELAALPEIAVVARLGEAGRTLHQLARGQHAHLLVPEEAAFSLAERVEFDVPVDHLDSLLFVLGPMLRQLLVRAGLRALALASVTVTLGLEGAPEHSRTLKPALPLFDHSILLKLLQLDLQAHPPCAGIVSVSLSAEPGPRADIQTGLFMPQTPEPARLEVTLARLSALVGEERVGRAKLLDTHAPEGFRMERFSMTDAPRRSSAQPCEAVLRNGIALRRLRPRVPITSHRDGDTPKSFYLYGLRYSVRRIHGPWRRSGQWWTPEVWSREEWDVEADADADGAALLCLFTHDLLRREWQIEGLYD